MKKKIKSGYDKQGKCKLCKEMRTDAGHDPCIANLPGVLYACCGHGQQKGYIKFEDGRCLSFHPLEMDLDRPASHLVRKSIPVFIRGERRRTLNYGTGEERVDEGEFEIMPGRGDRLLYERRAFIARDPMRYRRLSDDK